MEILLPEHSSDTISIKATTFNISTLPVQANLGISKVKMVEELVMVTMASIST